MEISSINVSISYKQVTSTWFSKASPMSAVSLKKKKTVQDNLCLKETYFGAPNSVPLYY